MRSVPSRRLSSKEAIASLLRRIIRRAKLSSRSPSTVRRLPRPSFMNNGLPMRSSRRRICMDTADCVLKTRSAALVKLPVSAIATKVCS
ncbi:hypothetical protein D3C72_1867900 [compost metagenome]